MPNLVFSKITSKLRNDQMGILNINIFAYSHVKLLSGAKSTTLHTFEIWC